MTSEDKLCPCGSGKDYEQCCKKEFDRANSAREKLKAAMSNPEKVQELKELLNKMNKDN